MLEFWNLIVQSNTFNFAVLVIILVIVWQKVDFSSKIDTLRFEIIDFMEKSKTEKKNAKKLLYDAQNEVKNLDKEIAQELDEANIRAGNVVKGIGDMTKKSVEKLEKNVLKVMENETRKVNNTLLNDTIDKAVLRSEEILKSKFSANPDLHEEYINRSLKILDKVKI